MTIAGLAIIIFYTIGLMLNIANHTLKKFKYQVFLAMLWVGMFVNIGYVVSWFPALNFMYFLEILFLITSFILKAASYNMNIRMSPKMIYSVALFIGAVTIAWINLIINPSVPDIIPYVISMDSVYEGINNAVPAYFGRSNIAHFIFFMLFIGVCIEGHEYFILESSCHRLLNIIKIMFHFMMIFWFVEFLFCNLVSNNLWRSILFQIFGFVEGKTYWGIKRYGIYGFAGLFTEQSYISIMFVYYAILYAIGIKGKKDVAFYYLSLALLILNGSTTGIMLLPFGLFVWFFPKAGKLTKRQFLRVVIGGLGLIFIVVMIMKVLPDFTNRIFDITISKLGTYFALSDYLATSLSGSIRSFGNGVALNAFLSCPIFGVGLGSTRGYGIITGMLACFGIVGSLAYFYMIKHFFGINYQRNRIIIIVALAYFYMILTVNYLYSATLIPLYLVFAYVSKRQEYTLGYR